MAEEVTIEYIYGGAEATVVVYHTEPIVFERTKVEGAGGPSYHYLARVSPEVARALSEIRAYRVWDGNPPPQPEPPPDSPPAASVENDVASESAATVETPEEPLPSAAEIDALIRQASELKRGILLDYADAHELRGVNARLTKGEILEAIRAYVSSSLPGYRALRQLLRESLE